MLLAFILSSPLIGFILNAFLLKKDFKKLSGVIGVLAPCLSFLALLFYALRFGFKHSQSVSFFKWIEVADLSLKFSFIIDSLSLIMCLLITGVGSLIHLYSFSYMFKDKSFVRYFLYLNLFIFMMLVLVLADNLPLLFVGWEGVGLCSYLLIGFWFKQEEKVASGSLAFIVNRIGDACFLLGIFLLFLHVKSFHFTEITAFFTNQTAQDVPQSLYFSALLIFLGAAGKSAQIPLYFWLPKAMAGPTPVSALIHAATMVTAGIYLLVRLSYFYMAFPNLLELIAWVGVFTALGAALLACKASDFKAVLAYSTISQLAFLFVALGVQAFSAGIFHLLTHGFFKALLFLCAGSVIHALHGEQNIKKMGGLRSELPITFLCYLVGALALMALPPLSGFFSKDEILWSLFSSGHYSLFALVFLTSLLTCFYMTRLTFYVFFGKLKTKNHKESLFLNIPLGILALLSACAGVLGIPHLISEFLPFHPPHFLHEILKDFSPMVFKGALWQEAVLMLASTVASLFVISMTLLFYQKNKLFTLPSFLDALLKSEFYVPRFIETYVQPSFKSLAQNSFQRIEESFFSAFAPFIVSQVLVLKKLFAQLQNGNLQSYALYFIVGLTFTLVLMFLN